MKCEQCVAKQTADELRRVSESISNRVTPDGDILGRAGMMLDIVAARQALDALEEHILR